MPLYEYLCETCGRKETFAKIANVVEGKVHCDGCGRLAPILPAGRMIGISPTAGRAFPQDDDRVITTNAEMRAYERELAARGQCIVSKDDSHYKALKDGIAEMGEVKAKKHGFANREQYDRERARRRALAPKRR